MVDGVSHFFEAVFCQTEECIWIGAGAVHTH